MSIVFEQCELLITFFLFSNLFAQIGNQKEEMKRMMDEQIRQAKEEVPTFKLIILKN